MGWHLIEFLSMGIRLALSLVKWPMSRDHYFTIYMVHERTIPTISFKVEWLYWNFWDGKPPKTPYVNLCLCAGQGGYYYFTVYSYMLSVSIFLVIYIVIDDCIILLHHLKQNVQISIGLEKFEWLHSDCVPKCYFPLNCVPMILHEFISM